MRRQWVSSIIAGVLLAQAYWVVPPGVRHGVIKRIGGVPLADALRAPLTYPFLDYPMYSVPHRAGEPVPQLTLIGVNRDESEILLLPETLKLSGWHYRFLLNAIRRSETARVRACLENIDSVAAHDLVSLRVEDAPILWGDGPPKIGKRQVVATLSLAGQ